MVERPAARSGRRLAPDQHRGLFLVPAAGAGLQGQIIGLANAGGDTINSIKQGAEFGIVAGGQKFAALLMFITDVHSLGLKVAQGLQFTSAFYWDRTTRPALSRSASSSASTNADHGAGGVYSATITI